MGYMRSLKDTISIVWGLQDVTDRAKQGGYDLKEGQALQVLELLKDKHDCNIGITWEVIDDHISMIAPASDNDDGFTWKSIEFAGKHFDCRVIPDLKDEGFELVVAPAALSVAMGLDRNGKGTPEATLLDERICFYATPLELKFSDRELFDYIFN